jgi:hypothetical protein
MSMHHELMSEHEKYMYTRRRNKTTPYQSHRPSISSSLNIPLGTGLMGAAIVEQGAANDREWKRSER